MKTEQPILITTISSSAEIEKNLFIGFDGNLCAEGAKSFGISNTSASIAEQLPVCVSGIALVLAGAPITAGDAVEADSNAKAITLDSGELNGYALDTANEADELIRILLK